MQEALDGSGQLNLWLLLNVLLKQELEWHKSGVTIPSLCYFLAESLKYRDVLEYLRPHRATQHIQNRLGN